MLKNIILTVVAVAFSAGVASAQDAKLIEKGGEGVRGEQVHDVPLGRWKGECEGARSTRSLHTSRL